MTKRSKQYLDFIRKQPCLVCGVNPSQAHHESLTGRGVGIKCSDFETIPLCPDCHRLRHTLGKASFSLAYGINYSAEIKKYQAQFT